VTLPELGVGIIYAPALEPLLEAAPDLITVVELEPQMLWLYDPEEEQPYRFAPGALERVRRLPQAKLVHGVGFPVGGSRIPDPRALDVVNQAIEALNPPWVSEHLSFNRAADASGEFNTGFLLPPLPTQSGVDGAVGTVRSVAARLPVPLAVETGVNYLQPQPWEMSDGAFAAAVARTADCGILLDLHNLWTNCCNGRQTVEEFLEEIPLERVWEVHLAGGMELDGYWLDAHSGPVPEDLLALFERVAPRLPELRAVIFEIMPAFAASLGLDAVRGQIERLRAIWEGRRTGAAYVASGRATRPPPADTPLDARTWEDCLGALVVGRRPEGLLAGELTSDPGVAILQKLVWNFRAGTVTGTLKLTTRLLLITQGAEGTRALLDGFFRSSPPQLFGSAEAEGFARYLAGQKLDVPYLADVLRFECATLRTLVHGRSRVARLHHDPAPLLEALAAGRLPAQVREGNYEVEITPDRATTEALMGQPLTTT